MRSRTNNILNYGVAITAALFAADRPALAARLLTATVELDGKRVLQTSYTDNGTQSRETMWRYLGSEPGWAETANILPENVNPLVARLEGNIVIRIEHGGSPLVQGRATAVELVRTNPTSDRWFISPLEVERLAAANGIAGPPVLSKFGPAVWVGMVGGLVILATAILLLVWVVWPRPRATGA